MTDKCKNKECDFYPHYGMAPHNHDLKKTGSVIGSTVLISRDKWPDNFLPDEEVKGAQGAYYCPECMKGYKEDKERMENNTLIS
jgi:hypothetical protein